MSVFHAVCTNGSLREFLSAPFVDIDMSERGCCGYGDFPQPDGPREEPLRLTGIQAVTAPLLAATHLWVLAFVVIPSLVA